MNAGQFSNFAVTNVVLQEDEENAMDRTCKKQWSLKAYEENTSILIITEEAAMNSGKHNEERVLGKFDTFRTYFRQK